MNGDERLDQLLRAALTWQADEAARDVPSLERSVRRLAERLGPEPVRLEPRVVARSGSGRSLQLIVAVLLLIAALAAAMAIGTQLLPRRGLEPAPFGYAGQCSTPARDEILYTVIEEDAPILAYEDGRFVKFLSNPLETRSAIFELGGLERRLAPRGQELLLERVARTMPEPGCRHLRAQAATGQISVFTPEGLIELSWHPSNPGRRLTTAEEADAEDLERALASPETWLPADAWLDATERRATPDRWLVFVELTPSGYGPGDEVTVSTGAVLGGSDPRYARVVLPGGQEPAEFGEVVAQRDTTTVRCGVLGTDEARALSDSLDALPLAMHDEEELFTDDLSRRVFIYIATGYPGEPDCATGGPRRRRPESDSDAGADGATGRRPRRHRSLQPDAGVRRPHPRDGPDAPGPADDARHGDACPGVRAADRRLSSVLRFAAQA